MGTRFSRLCLFSFAFTAFATMNVAPCLAQDAAAPVQEAPAPSPSAVAAEAPSMIIDPEANAFRFFIDGKEVARIDAGGLRVRESIEYGGAITDTGVEAYDQHALSLSEPGNAD